MIYLLWAKYLHKLLRIILSGRILPFSPSFCLFNYLFISAWTHIFFILLLIIRCHFIYAITQIVSALTTGTPLVGSYFFLTYSNILCMCVSVCVHMFMHSHRTPLFSGISWSSRLILHISCSASRILHFSKKTHFYLLENSIGHRNLGARWAHIIEFPLFVGLLICQQGKICVYTNPCMYTELWIFLHVPIFN